MSNEWLQNLKIGDKVIVITSGMGGKREAEVTSITKTQIRVSGSKFRRSTGFQISTDRWNVAFLEEWSKDKAEAIREGSNRRILVSKIRGADLLNNFSTSALESIVKVIDAENERLKKEKQ